MSTDSITIQDPVVETKPVVTPESVQDLAPIEREMAEKHGFIKKDEEVKAEVKETPKAEEKPAINPDELDTFEKIHDLHQTNPAEFYKLPKHMRNMYHNSKGLYKKLKEEEERRKDIEGKSEFAKVQDTVARVKLEKIKARLANPQDLTVEELQELIGIEQKIEEDKPLTKKDLDAIEEEKVQKQTAAQKAEQEKAARMNQKIADTEAYAIANLQDLTGGKFTDVNAVVALASEMAASKPRYAKQLNEAFADESMSEAETFEVILDIARLNPKYEAGKTEKVDATVEKMAKNANKQQTSAALSGGKGSRVVTYDDITPEDAVKLNQDQWNKLPRHVRDRVLKQL